MRGPKAALAGLLVWSSVAAAGELVDYTTKAGDTCESIAKEALGDPKRCDEIRAANSAVGKDPKAKLEAGKVLKIPKVEPLATLISSEGVATLSGASANNGTAIPADSPLVTGANGHAEVKLRDGGRFSLASQTTLWVLGKALPKGSKKPVPGDTTLSSGTVRLVSGTAPLKLDAPAGKVTVTGEAKVQVEGGVTRVSVWKGKATVGGLTIAEGSGARFEPGKGAKAVALPATPKWTSAPKAALQTPDEQPAAVTGIVGGTATRWHLVVALDPGFTEYLVDTEVKADGPTLLVEQKLPPGKFFVRVAALGADGLEGVATEVAPVTITSVKSKGKGKP